MFFVFLFCGKIAGRILGEKMREKGERLFYLFIYFKQLFDEKTLNIK